ncbi:hypothetical protein [Dyadobacter frigoris]|uniref:Uncharacterized protein n=1 Tax=Dyadobacter frigoris TaxID=2576211 RepID=A0A4U6CUL6_9BACT|nr:hypothetical protein [Dyadobacter frigoris]TKT87307.1 hypothetical protein FDK13_30110 [Dyadobacter frigoris]GLU55704.1 hypothetical protein Dfri01_51650 [Dyadobacter frigoris]
METGFNIVEVPGSKSRKVAGKKQQWYRTAILKRVSQYYNILHFSAFQKNVPVNYNVWGLKLFPYLLVQSGTGNNLIFFTDSEVKSVFSLKLQKTARFFFFGYTILLVKSYFSSFYNEKKMDFAAIVVVSGGKGDKFKNK